MDNSQLPDWLNPELLEEPKPSLERKQLAITQYETVFPRLMNMVSSGYTLNRAIRELPIEVDSGAFLRWMRKDPAKYEIYKEAKEIRTETWAGRMIDHAEGESMEDVQRSRLIIDTYKWLMSADNRRTYGDTKSIEVNGNISITAALQQAQARLVESVIDAELIDEPQDRRLLSDSSYSSNNPDNQDQEDY